MTRKEALKTLVSLKRLEYNWGGYGESPVSLKCLRNAINLLNILDCVNIFDIFLNNTGTITIIWKDKLDNYLELEMGEKEYSYYLISDNILIKKENKVFNNENILILNKIVNNLFNG